jgi:hypothetical protein
MLCWKRAPNVVGNLEERGRDRVQRSVSFHERVVAGKAFELRGVNTQMKRMLD